jgi:acyl-coenzyme A synthetase/AMP-(fatty) acid ligase
MPLSAKIAFQTGDVPVFRIPAPEKTLAENIPEIAVAEGHVGGQILQSSGTTGLHKRLLLQSKNENMVFEDYLLAYPNHPDDAYYAMDFGLWSSAGYKAPAWKWWVGGCTILDQSPHMLERFFTYRFDSAFLIQPHLKAVVEMAKATGRKLESTSIYFGGGPLPAALARDALKWLTPDLHQTYGSTEIISPCLHTESLVDGNEFHWLRETGRRTVSVVGPDGAECPPNTMGTLRIQLEPADFSEYLDDPVTTAVFFKGNWFYPGDLAIKRNDGRFRIEGRETDTIVIGGIKFGIAPMEAKAREWFGVDDICIFTRMTADGKNEICFVLETSNPIDASANAQMVAFLSAAKIRHFDRGQICAMAELPRAANGMRKLNRKAVREAVMSGMIGGAL